VVIDSTHVHSGSKALKLTALSVASGPRAFAVLHGPPVFPAPVHNHYGRMWIWISAVLGVNGSYTHVDNIEATGTIDGTTNTDLERVRYGASLYSNDTSLSLLGNLSAYDLTGNNTIDAALANGNPVPVPLGQWLCYEWHFGSPGMIGEFWLNGVYIDGLTPPGFGWNSSWQYPLIDSVSVGWQAWGDLPDPTTVWIDDVAVGTSRLGCRY